jgi:hypothetical protein
MKVYIVKKSDIAGVDNLKAFYTYESAVDFMEEVKAIYMDEIIDLEIEPINLE